MNEIEVKNGTLQIPAQVRKIFEERREKLKRRALEDLEWAEQDAALLKAMEENGIKKHEDDLVRITYVAPTERESLDTKAVKELLKENGLLEMYTKKTVTNASVRVTFKTDEEREFSPFNDIESF